MNNNDNILNEIENYRRRRCCNRVCFGPTGPTGPAGPSGGATGPTGPTGSSATLAVGTTTTGAPGTAAKVTNSGTESAAVFNFVIPEGIQGATGEIGPTCTYPNFYKVNYS